MEASIDDPRSGGLIDDFYTDFYVAEEDRLSLERFLQSSNLENRREALIALMFSTGVEGPRFTGYAIDALLLHLLGVVEDAEAKWTGVSILAELRTRGDQQADAILKALETSKKWHQKYMG